MQALVSIVMATGAGAGRPDGWITTVRASVVAAADGLATALWRQPERATAGLPLWLSRGLVAAFALWAAMLVVWSVNPGRADPVRWATYTGGAVVSVAAMAVALRWPIAGWRVAMIALVVGPFLRLELVPQALDFLVAPTVCILLGLVGLQLTARTAAAATAATALVVIGVAVANQDPNILAAAPFAVIIAFTAIELRSRHGTAEPIALRTVARGFVEAAGDGLANIGWRRVPRTSWPTGRFGVLLAVGHVGWAVVLGAGVINALLFPVPGPDGLVVVALSGLAAVATAVAVRRPVWGWRIVMIAYLGASSVVSPTTLFAVTFVQVTACVLVGMIGLRLPVRTAVAAGAVTVLGTQLIDLLVPEQRLGSVLPAVVATVVVTCLLRSRRLTRVALAAEQRRSLDALAERAVLAERARIAREMHDVVAHHMSMIAVRCESAPYRLTGLDGAAGAEFGEIAAAARAALVEMQSLLGVLRAPDQAVEHAPQPGLGDLAGLLDAAAAASGAVTWSVALDDVPERLGRTIYRLVQQGLTNAAQHARGAAVRVEVTGVDDTVRVVIVNGVGADGGPTAGSGQGLIGMRERVELHGGRLAAGPDPDGGFTVVAELPLTAQSRSAAR